MNNNYERIQSINIDTGEIICETLKKENEELSVKAVKKVSEEQKKAHHKMKIVQALHDAEVDAMKRTNQTYGGYVTTYYVKDQLLLKGTGLEYQDIARVLFLGTHLGYKQDTGNMLVVKRNQRVIEPMTREDMMDILGLKERALKTFISNAKKSGVLEVKKKQFFLSEEYFAKGEVEKSNNKGYTRLYVNPIKNLFNGVKSPKQHIGIGIVMSLIPFLNYDMNYLEKSNGDYMTLQEMNELLGYDKSNVSKLFKSLRGVKIEFGGREHHIITQMVLNEASDEREERIYINPMICYRGKCETYHQEVIRCMLFGKGKEIK